MIFVRHKNSAQTEISCFDRFPKILRPKKKKKKISREIFVEKSVKLPPASKIE